MFFSVANPYLWLIIPAVICQYILAIFCLLKLLFLNLPKTKFWIWNFFILIVFYIGGITFLLCRYVFKTFPVPVAENVSPTEPIAQAPAAEPTESKDE